jgi:N utilization substance protein B
MPKANEHHRARRLALQGLCCLDVQGQRVMDLVLAFINESHEVPATLAEAHQMLLGAFNNRQQADELLAGQSQHWDVGRMAMVDRNVLRLAVWEMAESRLPHSIAISEALLLAKEFATAESPRFINGVLDAVSKKLQERDMQG